MKHLKTMLAAVLFVAVSALAWAGTAQAQSFTANVPKGKTVNSAVYATGKTVTIHGTVNGDIYCAAQEVTITGFVHGDVLCVGQRVTVKGHVDGSIRAAGQEIKVEGSVGRNLTIAAQQFTLGREARVGQDVTLSGSSATFQGEIGRDVVIGGSSAIFDSKVGRNVRFNGSELKLQDKARINGSITYTSTRTIDEAGGAQVKGETTHLTPKRNSEFFGISYATLLMGALAMLVLALVLVALLPRPVHKVSGVAVDSLGKTILMGFIALFGFPLVAAVLFGTVIGLPMAIAVGLIGLLVLVFSGPVTAYYLGSMILSKSKNPIHIVLIGGAVLVALYLLPIIGPFFMFTSYIIGAGAILLAARRYWPKPVYSVE